MKTAAILAILVATSAVAAADPFAERAGSKVTVAPAAAPSDPGHARKVLTEFGRAFGCLPDEPTADQARFLDQAVDGLKRQDGRIIPVRPSLFAEIDR